MVLDIYRAMSICCTVERAALIAIYSDTLNDVQAKNKKTNNKSIHSSSSSNSSRRRRDVAVVVGGGGGPTP